MHNGNKKAFCALSGRCYEGHDGGNDLRWQKMHEFYGAHLLASDLPHGMVGCPAMFTAGMKIRRQADEKRRVKMSHTLCKYFFAPDASKHIFCTISLGAA